MPIRRLLNFSVRQPTNGKIGFTTRCAFCRLFKKTASSAATIQIVSSNSLIASEKLEVKNMTRKAKNASKRKRQKAGLNRSILDVGWGALTGAIKYKLEEGNGVFVEVPTKTVKPSQTCPKCLHQQKKELSERVAAPFAVFSKRRRVAQRIAAKNVAIPKIGI